MKLFEKKTIGVTRSQIFWFAFIVIILITFVISAFMMKSVYFHSEDEGSAVELSDITLVQLDAPKSGQTILEITTTVGTMKAMVFSEEAPDGAAFLISAAESGAFDGAQLLTSESGAVITAEYSGEEMSLEKEIHKNLWPFKGAVCLDGGGNLIFINTVEFTDEMKSYLSSQTELSDVCKAFLEHGGIPNLSQQYTVAAQIFEGEDVLESLSASDNTAVITGITVLSAQ